jgi:hypothetical protein
LLSIISSLIIPLFNFTWFTIEKEHQQLLRQSLPLYRYSSVIPIQLLLPGLAFLITL